jgi:phosphoribosyl 1,2-cyclic phosphodiesterase
MVRVTLVGSGSRGNSMIVEFSETRIAVDAGYGHRVLASRLNAAGIAPRSVGTCVLTHEHIDHVRGASKARDRWDWHLVATGATLAGFRARATPNATELAHGQPYNVQDVRVTLISVPHDAAAPSAVLLEDVRSGIRVGVAYDLGQVPAALRRAFAGVDVLVLEANHDVAMLRAGPYPVSLQNRIVGARGHLSNDQSAEFAASIAHRGLRAVVLAHLSEQNNTPRIAHARVAHELRRTPFRGVLVTADQDNACAVGDYAPEQLSLL